MQPVGPGRQALVVQEECLPLSPELHGRTTVHCMDPLVLTIDDFLPGDMCDNLVGQAEATGMVDRVEVFAERDETDDFSFYGISFRSEKTEMDPNVATREVSLPNVRMPPCSTQPCISDRTGCAIPRR